MKRRRLTLIAVTVILLVGGLSAALLWPDRVTAEERPFVGVWTFRQGGLLCTITLTADHQCIIRDPNNDTLGAGRWWVRDGQFFEDYEPSSVRRVLRPLARTLGLTVRPAGSAESTVFDLDGSNKKAHFFRVKSN